MVIVMGDALSVRMDVEVPALQQVMVSHGFAIVAKAVILVGDIVLVDAQTVLTCVGVDGGIPQILITAAVTMRIVMEHVIVTVRVEDIVIVFRVVETLPTTAELVPATEIIVIVTQELNTVTGPVFWEIV